MENAPRVWKAPRPHPAPGGPATPAARRITLTNLLTEIPGIQGHPMPLYVVKGVHGVNTEGKD